MTKPGDKYPPHFTLEEFLISGTAPQPLPRGDRGEYVANNLRVLAWQLEHIREEIKQPIRVLSGYRSPAYNAKIGGAKQSQHMEGRAADITVKDLPPTEVHAVITRLIGEGAIMQGGLGLYKYFVHYDTRGTRARWIG